MNVAKTQTNNKSWTQKHTLGNTEAIKILCALIGKESEIKRTVQTTNFNMKNN